MRTEDLIVELAGQGVPVTPLLPLSVRLTLWMTVASAAAAGVAFGLGPRADLGAALTRGPYLVSGLLTLGSAVLGGWAALQSSVPGALRHAWMRWAPLALLAAWCVLIAAALVSAGAPFSRLAAEPWHAACVVNAMAAAAIPAVGLFVMVRRGLPLSPAWSAALAAVAALGFGAFGAQVICPIDRAAHLGLWHLIPVVSLAALTALVGASFLRVEERNRG